MDEHRACLGLGSNAEPSLQLPRALAALGRLDGLAVLAASRAWQSPAAGPTAGGPDYLNAAALVSTRLGLAELTDRLKALETALGRDRDRPDLVAIDLDVLVFDDQAILPGLWDLAYRAVPAAEVLGDLIDPATGEALAGAARRLAGSTPIRPRPEVLPGLSPATPASSPSFTSLAPGCPSWPT